MTAYADGSLFYYAPNKGAAIAYAALFAISGVIHLWQCFRFKSFKMTIFLPWGAAVLSGGYAMRAVGAWNIHDVGVFVATTVMLIMGPPVYAACLYVVLGRTMYYIPWLSPIHPGRVITTFVGLDVLCELLLGTGAPRSSNSSLSRGEQRAGWALVKAGMILQCVLFVMFFALAGHFHRKCYKHGVEKRIRGVMLTIYAAGLLILERTALRTGEMFEGYTGTIYTSEPIFYVLEATVMLLVTVILNIWHPARLLPQSNKIYLATDGVTEREGPGWVDKRPFLLTLFDPFDLGSLCSKKNANVKFWENNEGKAVSVLEQPKHEAQV